MGIARTSTGKELPVLHEARESPPAGVLRPMEATKWSKLVSRRHIHWPDTRTETPTLADLGEDDRESTEFPTSLLLFESPAKDGGCPLRQTKVLAGLDDDCSSQNSEGSRLRASVDFGPMGPPSPALSARTSIKSPASVWTQGTDKYVRPSNLALVKFAPSVSAAGASLTLSDGLANKIRHAETRGFMVRKQKLDSRAVFSGGFGAGNTRQLPAAILAVEATIVKLVLLREQHLTDLKRELDFIEASRDEYAGKVRYLGQRRTRQETEPDDIGPPTWSSGSTEFHLERAAVCLAQLRGVSVEVVEAIAIWRRTSERHVTEAATGVRSGRFFKWEGKNYLIKMSSDIDVLGQHTAFQEIFNLAASRNPFLVPPETSWIEPCLLGTGKEGGSMRRNKVVSWP